MRVLQRWSGKRDQTTKRLFFECKDFLESFLPPLLRLLLSAFLLLWLLPHVNNEHTPQGYSSLLILRYHCVGSNDDAKTRPHSMEFCMRDNQNFRRLKLKENKTFYGKSMFQSRVATSRILFIGFEAGVDCSFSLWSGPYKIRVSAARGSFYLCNDGISFIIFRPSSSDRGGNLQW